MSRAQGIKLENVTGAIDCLEGHRLLMRVVSVNGDDKPTLPVRELWAAYDEKESKLEYAIFYGNCVYSTVMEEDVSLDDVNDAMHFTGGASWLPHDKPMARPVDPDGWLVTEIVRTQPSIWVEDAPSSTSKDQTQVINEKNLIKWLSTDDEDGADCDWDEADWVDPDPVDPIPAEELSSDENVDADAENNESEREYSSSSDGSSERAEEGSLEESSEHACNSEASYSASGYHNASDEGTEAATLSEENGGSLFQR